jgi:WXG100 family type VII secretion target
MSHIYVEHARLENAAAALRAHKRTFDDVLAQLESDLAPMIATWSGAARDLYLQKKAAWDRAALDLTELLATIGNLTQDAHRAYVATVDELVQMWS